MNLPGYGEIRRERLARRATLSGLRADVVARLAELEAKQLPSARRAGRVDELRKVLDFIDRATGV